MANPAVATAPAAEPIAAADVKSHGRISTSADDTLLGTLITAIREDAEAYTGRAFVNRTLDLYLDGFDDPRFNVDGAIWLPFPPVSSVTSIKYQDQNDDQQTWSTDQYVVDYNAEPARITLAYGATLPLLYPKVANVVIRYVAGYGAAAANVPESIKLALRQSVTTVYDLARATHMDSPFELRQLPLSGRRMLSKYRVLTFGHG